MVKVAFTDKDIQVLGKKSLYKGFFSMDAYTFKHKLFAGGWSEPITREVFERGDAVVVLPYDPIADKVILIEQVRLPALAKSKSPWLLELVAGMIDSDCEPEAVAHKELFEEAGLTASNMVLVNRFLSSPGGTSERFFFYWAQVDSTLATGLHGLDDEHEDIKLHVVSRQQAYDQVVSGDIDNASTVIGLQWLQLNYDKLDVIK